MAEPRYVVHVWSAGVRTSYTQPLPDERAWYQTCKQSPIWEGERVMG